MGLLNINGPKNLIAPNTAGSVWGITNVLLTDNEASPDNSNTAIKVVGNGGGGILTYAPIAVIYQATNQQILTFSCLLKGLLGTEQLTIAMRTNATVFVSSLVNLTTSWVRYYITTRITGSLTGNRVVVGHGNDIDNGETFWMWCPQINLGSYPDDPLITKEVPNS